jgi:hypothetical protein
MISIKAPNMTGGSPLNSGLFASNTKHVGRNHMFNNHPNSTMHDERHKKLNYKIEFLNPTAIDSIPIDSKYSSMINRKTLPGGKKVPNTSIYTEGSKTSMNFNMSSSVHGGGFKV